MIKKDKNKKIIIGIWSCPETIEKKTGYKHQQRFDYSKTIRNKIIHRILNAGLNIQVIQHEDFCVIWIDTKTFKR